MEYLAIYVLQAAKISGLNRRRCWLVTLSISELVDASGQAIHWTEHGAMPSKAALTSNCAMYKLIY
jgi:hypothetical protein